MMALGDFASNIRAGAEVASVRHLRGPQLGYGTLAVEVTSVRHLTDRVRRCNVDEGHCSF